MSRMNRPKEYAPGDLVIFNGNASPARILEKTLLGTQTFYNVIVRRGGEATIQRCIAPDMIRPLTMEAIENLLGGPSNVEVRDETPERGDFKVTVLCHSPNVAQNQAA